MNSSSNNQPRPAAVEQGPLPALPDWCYRDDLGGLVPSEIRTALNEHARAAWNMGLDAGLLHAPAVTDTGLPELRDHLATAKVIDRSITLSAAAAGALHLAMTTPPKQPAARQSDALVDWAAYIDGPELQELKAEALALAADGANWSMEVDCMFVLAMIERIQAGAAPATPQARRTAIRFEILGDVGLEPVIGEQFVVAGSTEVFTIHGSTYTERTAEGFYWSATHVETGLRIAKGNDINAVIEEARALWLGKTPDELEHAIAAGRSRRATAWAVSLTEDDMAGSAT